MKGDVGQKGHPGMDAVSSCTVYTLWGKSTCPDGDETLSSGYAASPVHYQSGGGTNYMCLPDMPSFDAAANAATTVQASVVGVRYNTVGEPLENVDFHPVQCAICSTTRAAQLMIPGSAVCPPLWNMVYNGYLMSAGDTPSGSLTLASIGEAPPPPPTANFRTEYICVCGNPDSSTPRPDAEAQLYHVHLDCTAGDSLNCGSGNNYDTLSQLTCAVCTTS